MIIIIFFMSTLIYMQWIPKLFNFQKNFLCIIIKYREKYNGWLTGGRVLNFI